METVLSPLQSRHLKILSNLWQLYIFECSGRDQIDVDSDGRFEIPEKVFADVAERRGSLEVLEKCVQSLAILFLPRDPSA